MQDTTTVQVVTDTVGPVATVLIGAASSLATGAVRAGTQWVDDKLTVVNGKVTRSLGPVWPIVVTGFSMALPLLGNALHLTDLPTAQVIATAPVSAIIGIALREAFRHLVPERKSTP